MFATTQELLTLLQEEVGDTSPTGTTSNRLLKILNRANQIIHAGGGELNLDKRNNPVRRPFIFPWALAANPKIIALEPATEGTCTLTALTNAVTVSVDSAIKDLTDFEIKFDKIVYRITNHTGTIINLDSQYIEDTSITTFTAFKVVYTIGNDIMITTDEIKVYSARGALTEISMIDMAGFLDRYPKNSTAEGTPSAAAVVLQGVGTLTLRFNKYPSETLRAEMSYVPIPADLDLVGSNPLMPKHHRTVLVHLAAFYHLVKRDDDRASSHLETAKNLFDNLTTEARQINFSNNKKYLSIRPWVNGFPGYTRSGFTPEDGE